MGATIITPELNTGRSIWGEGGTGKSQGFSRLSHGAKREGLPQWFVAPTNGSRRGRGPTDQAGGGCPGRARIGEKGTQTMHRGKQVDGREGRFVEKREGVACMIVQISSQLAKAVMSWCCQRGGRNKRFAGTWGAQSHLGWALCTGDCCTHKSRRLSRQQPAGERTTAAGTTVGNFAARGTEEQTPKEAKGDGLER